jgi:ABC-type transporter Mla subunit MlaD
MEELSVLLGGSIKLSQLVDCLNCEKGCNGGPGTGNHGKSLAELEAPVSERSEKLESAKQVKNLKKYHKQLNRYWKDGLYKREYRDLSGNNTLKQPSEAELEQVYQSMKKYKKEDLYNCTSCGYGSCQVMATAIFNKLNKPENCAHYNLAVVAEKESTIEKTDSELNTHISQALELIEGINMLMKKLNIQVGEQADEVQQSSTVTEKILDSIKETSDNSRKKQELIQTLITNAGKGKEAMQETIRSVQGISQSVDGISDAIKIISSIAANTNILSMNAAIEAAHAGNSGRGFAVVADEIRKLADNTRENSRNISKTLKEIIDGINVTTKRSEDTGELINGMAEEINDIAETMTNLINTLGELSNESSEITAALNELRTESLAVKKDNADILSKTDELRNDMVDLAKVASNES